MLAPRLRWGVLGPGWIAERFVGSLRRSTRQQVVAVASRDLGRAAAFASRWGIDHAYGGYQALVEDPGVDVVYVATPHNAHRPCALLAIEAGRHTLVEKPLALNAAEVAELAAAARGNGVFLMEALWTVFLPRFDVLRQVLADGLLGEVRTVLAEVGEHFGPEHRIMRADLAGGPLLDLGTYPAALATMVLGPAERVLASGQPAPGGVNGQASILATHAGGAQSVLHTTLFSDTPSAATIAGTEATATLPGPFYQPGDLRVRFFDGAALEHREPAAGHGALHFQAAHLAAAVDGGLLESPLRPLADSLATIRVLDEVRGQLGVVFAEEARGG
ncbi:MAG TPA: Gfo/Idh/MocA family oxidoreductase [Actinomycetota bacterium]|nr:Gfo/Idh/MocA family oxidoreductase [Actinomycetota bacterium]